MKINDEVRDRIQHEAGLAIRDKIRAGLDISMGVGKTRICINDMLYHYVPNVKYLVLAPTLDIHKDWKNEIQKMKCEYLLPHITFSTYRSLNKQPYDFHTVYLDECQALMESYATWMKNYASLEGRTIGVTGTYPVRGIKARMCKWYCPRVYKYEIDQAVKENILNDVKIIVHELELDKENTLEKKTRTGETFKTSERKNYDWWTKEKNIAKSNERRWSVERSRMTDMQKYPSKLQYAKTLFDAQTEKTIIFCNTKEQADELCSHSYYSNHPEDNLSRFKNGEITKLSCIQMASRGVNIPNLKVGIIMHAYGNNENAAQRIGRLLRLSSDDLSVVHILCYKDTVDKKWVKQALVAFEGDRVTWTEATKEKLL